MCVYTPNREVCTLLIIIIIYPKPPGNFLTSEVVLPRSIRHKPVGREVYQH